MVFVVTAVVVVIVFVVCVGCIYIYFLNDGPKIYCIIRECHYVDIALGKRA